VTDRRESQSARITTNLLLVDEARGEENLRAGRLYSDDIPETMLYRYRFTRHCQSFFSTESDLGQIEHRRT